MNISKAVGTLIAMVEDVVAVTKEAWRRAPRRLVIAIAVLFTAIVMIKAVVAMVLGAVFYKFAGEKNLWQNLLPWLTGKRNNLLDVAKKSEPVVSGVAVNEPEILATEKDSVKVAGAGGYRGNSAGTDIN